MGWPTCCCAPRVYSERFVAAEMAMQVIHWEKVGVMDLFRATSEQEAGVAFELLVQKHPSLLSHDNPSRDNVGAALLHWAVIHRGVFHNSCASAIMEHLLVNHSDVVNIPYMDNHRPLGLFDGETALHLAVAFGDCELIHMLIDHGADPTRRAYGSFFSPSGTCYFGEFPLSFAVACGNLEVAKLLVRKWKELGQDPFILLNARDSHGNTALHMAVIHRRPEIFDWLLSQQSAPRSSAGDKVDKQRYLDLHGALGLTPLGLATVLAHVDEGRMFDHVLNSMSRVEWVFGRVKCTSIPLNQIDTVPISNPSKHISVLSLVLCRRVYDLSTRPQLVAIMEAKWSQFAGFAFFSSFVVHVVRLYLVTHLAIEYRHYTDLLAEGEKDPPNSKLMLYEWLVLGDSLMQCILTLLDCFGGYAEHRDAQRIASENLHIHAAIPEALRNKPGGTAVWNTIRRQSHNVVPQPSGTTLITANVPLSEYDGFAWIGQVLTICHLASLNHNDKRPNATSTAFLSFALLMIWLSTLKYTAFSRVLGMLVTIVFRTVRQDVTAFLTVFTIFLIGFGTATHVLTRYSYSSELDRLVKTALGDTSTYPRWAHSTFPELSWLAYLLAVCFAISALVILLNLLISIFSCTFAAIKEKSEKEWRLAKGRATLLLERRMRMLGLVDLRKMRVNHFEGFHSDKEHQHHRFVFMTEEHSTPKSENESITRSVSRGVVHALKAIRRANAEDLLLEAAVTRDPRLHFGSDEDEEEEEDDDEGNSNPLEAPSEAGALISAAEGILAPAAEAGSPKVNPLNVMPAVRRCDGGLWEAAVGVPCVDMRSYEEQEMEQLQQAFDTMCGPGTWEGFVAWVTEEIGGISELRNFTAADLRDVVTDYVGPDVPAIRRGYVVKQLSIWATPPGLPFPARAVAHQSSTSSSSAAASTARREGHADLPHPPVASYPTLEPLAPDDQDCHDEQDAPDAALP